MKKHIILIMFTMSIIIMGCSSKEPTESTSESKSEEERSITELKVSAMHPEDHPQTQAVIGFKEAVEKETEGSIEFDIFPANQLGDYKSVYEEVARGTIDAALLSLASDRDSRLEILGFPYLISTYEEAEKMYSKDSFAYQLVEDIVSEHGVKLLGLRALGFGGTSATKEIKNPKTAGMDKDLVVRVPQINIHRIYAEELGFRTVSLPYEDIFSGLQTGTVEGVTTNPASSAYQNFKDVVKHYYRNNDTFEASVLIINQDLWNSLSDEEQEILARNGEVFTQEGIQEAEKIDNEYVDKLKEEGIEIHEYTEKEIQEMAEYIRENAWTQVSDEMQEVLNEARKDIE